MKKVTSRDLAIAETVLRRRVALGLSPRSVKQLCRIEPRDLKRYEAGVVPFSSRRLKRICLALLLEPEDLLANLKGLTHISRSDSDAGFGDSLDATAGLGRHDPVSGRHCVQLMVGDIDACGLQVAMQPGDLDPRAATQFAIKV